MLDILTVKDWLQVHPLTLELNPLIDDFTDQTELLLPVGDPLLERLLVGRETHRLRHNLPTIAAIDGLQKLYCTDNIFATLARSTGLQIVDSSPLLKGIATAQAGR